MFVFMNKNKFYNLKVVDIKRMTADSVMLTFDIPSDIKSLFSFNAGQNLTLKTHINGEEIRRSYSLCTAPSEDKWSVLIKKVDGGLFSTFANEQLKPGDLIDVMPPTGNFTLDKYNDSKHFLFFAAGSGITPIISQIKDLLMHHAQSNITLFFGNKNFSSIIFREEIEALKNKYLGRFSVHHIFTKEKIGIDLLYGRIDKAKCVALGQSLFNPNDMDACMICGPNEMIFEVKDGLVSLGFDPKNIHFELFNTDGLKKLSNATETNATINEDLESEITIQMDGDIFEFTLGYGGQNLLDAAIENGADLPYSCKGGVCSTCKAKLTKGEVKMDLNYSLEPYEVDAGYILMCQSHPRTPKIYVDFDQK